MLGSRVLFGPALGVPARAATSAKHSSPALRTCPIGANKPNTDACRTRVARRRSSADSQFRPFGAKRRPDIAKKSEARRLKFDCKKPFGLFEALRHRVGLPARRQRLRTRGRKHGGGLFDDANADDLKTTKRLSWQACRAAAVLLTRRAGSYLMRQDQVQRACRTTHLFGPPAQLDI